MLSTHDLMGKLDGKQSNQKIMQVFASTRAMQILSSLAILQLTFFLVYFPFAIIVTPYGDMFDWLAGFYNLSDKSVWEYLWAPHNGHRIVFTKLLTIGDARIFGGAGYPVALICMSSFLFVAAIAVIGIRRSVEDPKARRWVTAVAVLLLFPTSSFASLAYPVNSQHLLVVFFVFLACVLLVRSGTGAGNTLRQRTYFLLAMAAAVCATLTSLNGLMVWPILVWMSWVLRFGTGKFFAVVTLGMLTIAAFSYRYVFLGYRSSVTDLNVAQLVKYLIEYHGMPWVGIGPLYWPAIVFGLAILSVCIFSLKNLLAPRMLKPIGVVALAMLVFSLSTAAMIAVGRHQLDLLPAHRYSIFLLTTFVALFVLYIPVFERWLSNQRGYSLVMQITLAVSIVYLGQQAVIGQFAVQRVKDFARYEKEMLAGAPSPQAVNALYFPSADVLKERYHVLEKQRIYMFRPSAPH